MPIDQGTRLAARMLRNRKPSASLYAAYRESADAFFWAHHGSGPPIRAKVPDGHLLTARPSFHSSVLFGYEYLVAWVDDNEAFARAFRGTDAITTPFPTSLPWTSEPIPLILAPRRRSRSRSLRFLSILEHEIVHVNQLIAGLSFSDFEARTAAELLDRFFGHTRLEYEAHLIQSGHWPPKLDFGTLDLTVNERALLQAYLPAIEKILGAVVAGRIPARILPGFPDSVLKAAPARLRRMGFGPEMVTWFRTQWKSDAAAVGLQFLRTTKMDRNHVLARVVRG
jgi:hypothetical protein